MDETPYYLEDPVLNDLGSPVLEPNSTVLVKTFLVFVSPSSPITTQ